MEHAQLKIAFADHLPRSQRAHWNAPVSRGLQQLSCGWVEREPNAFPDPSRPEIVGQCDGSAEMVGIGMRDEHGIERPDAARPERRSQHAVADVDASAKRN